MKDQVVPSPITVLLKVAPTITSAKVIIDNNAVTFQMFFLILAPSSSEC